MFACIIERVQTALPIWTWQISNIFFIFVQTRVVESEETCPTPTLPKFPPLKEFSISIYVSKKIAPFEQARVRIPITLECVVKNNSIRFPESDKKNTASTPTPSVFRNPTPPSDSLRRRLCNPAFYQTFSSWFSAKAVHSKTELKFQ